MGVKLQIRTNRTTSWIDDDVYEEEFILINKFTIASKNIRLTHMNDKSSYYSNGQDYIEYDLELEMLHEAPKVVRDNINYIMSATGEYPYFMGKLSKYERSVIIKEGHYLDTYNTNGSRKKIQPKKILNKIKDFLKKI